MSDKDNENIYEELYLGQQKVLGYCKKCDKVIYKKDPHVEVSTVIYFGNGTAKTDTVYLHLESCYEFKI